MGYEMPSSQYLDVLRAEMLFTNFFVVQNIVLCLQPIMTSVVAHVSAKASCEGRHVCIH